MGKVLQKDGTEGRPLTNKGPGRSLKSIIKSPGGDPVLILTLYEGLNFKLKEDGEYCWTARLQDVALRRVYPMTTAQTEYKFKNHFVWRLPKVNFEKLCKEGRSIDVTLTTTYAGRTVCAGRCGFLVSRAALDRSGNGFRNTTHLQGFKRFLFQPHPSPAVVFSLRYFDNNSKGSSSLTTTAKHKSVEYTVGCRLGFWWSFNSKNAYRQLGEPKDSDELYTLTIILGGISRFFTLCPTNSTAKSLSSCRISFTMCGKDLVCGLFDPGDEEDMTIYIGDKFVICVQADRNEFCRYLQEIVVEVHVESVGANGTVDIIGTAALILKDFMVPEVSEIKQNLKIIPAEKTKSIVASKAELFIISRLRRDTDSVEVNIPDSLRPHGKPDDTNVERESNLSREIILKNTMPQSTNDLAIPDVLKSGLYSAFAIAGSPLVLDDKLELIDSEHVLSEKIESRFGSPTRTSGDRCENETLIGKENNLPPPINSPVIASLQSSFPSINYSSGVYELDFECRRLRIRSMRVFKLNWSLKLSHPLLLGQEYLLIGRPKDSGINLYTDFDFDKKLTLVLASADFFRGRDLNNKLDVRFSCPETHATDGSFIAHASISLGEIFEVKESEKIYNRVDVFSIQCPPVRAGFLHYTLTLLKKS